MREGPSAGVMGSIAWRCLIAGGAAALAMPAFAARHEHSGLALRSGTHACRGVGTGAGGERRTFADRGRPGDLSREAKDRRSQSYDRRPQGGGGTHVRRRWRPFACKGTRFALATEASYNQNSKKTNPRTAGLASFPVAADRRMGPLVSGA